MASPGERELFCERVRLGNQLFFAFGKFLAETSPVGRRTAWAALADLRVQPFTEGGTAKAEQDRRQCHASSRKTAKFPILAPKLCERQCSRGY